MIKVNVGKPQKKKSYIETITVYVYYAQEFNSYNLEEGWYEWDQNSPVPKDQTGWLKIARMPNEPCKRWVRDQELKNRKKKRRGKISTEESESQSIRALSKFGLLGWGGFTDHEGNELEYDDEVGYNAFCNDPSFLDFVSELCMDDELFFGKNGNPEEEQAKN